MKGEKKADELNCLKSLIQEMEENEEEKNGLHTANSIPLCSIATER